MISKNIVKYIKSLSTKKHRQIESKFIAEGPKIVEDIIASNLKVHSIYGLKEWIQENHNIKDYSEHLYEISEEELNKISSLSNPNQVLAIVDIPVTLFDISFAETNMVIVLDDIRDPGNLGTIIRIADWFGIEHILCSNESVDAFNPKVVQASMGSICRVNVYYEDLAGLLSPLSNDYPIYGAFLEGNSIYSESFSKNGFLVIGNESKGISYNIAKLINRKLHIPSGNNNKQHAESLNASIALAIICSEINRQNSLL